MASYTENYFQTVNRQLTNVLESEDTFNLIEQYARINPAFKESTGGIVRHIMATKPELVGMTDNEIESDPYKATARYLRHTITDVATRVFENSKNQFMEQGMSEDKAAIAAEKIASTTANNLVKPLLSDDNKQRTGGIDKLLGIMTKPNIDNGKIEIDLNRITIDPTGTKRVNEQSVLNLDNKSYTIQPITDEAYTPYIAKGIDLGGEWYDYKSSLGYIGSLGSSTLTGQAITGLLETFDGDAAEWIGARREFERNVMNGENGSLWSLAYTGRDMAATIGETTALTAMTGGWFGPVLQTPIRSALNEWVEESGQLSMQYMTGDDRMKANTEALATNILFDTVTMAASVGLGKVAESAFQAFGVTAAMPKFFRETANGTILRNIFRTTEDLALDTAVDLTYYNATGANIDDDSYLTQNTRNMYNAISKMPDFTDPEYIEALGGFLGRKFAGRFMGGLVSLRNKEKGDYFDTAEYNESALRMNKVQSWINRLVAPPSSFAAVDELIRSRNLVGEETATTFKEYLDSGDAKFKDIFKLYMDREFSQSALFRISGVHRSLFSDQNIFKWVGLGDMTSTESNKSKVYSLVNMMGDLYHGLTRPDITESTAPILAKKVSENIVEDINKPDLTDDQIKSAIEDNLNTAESVLKSYDKKAKDKYESEIKLAVSDQLKKAGRLDLKDKVLDWFKDKSKNKKGFITLGKPLDLEIFREVTEAQQQRLVDKLISDESVKRARTIQIKKQGEAEYKTVDITSQEYKDWATGLIKQIKDTDISSGLGLNDKERATITEAYDEIQTMAAKMLSLESFEDGVELLSAVRPTLKKATETLLDGYLAGIKKTQTDTTMSSEMKKLIYAKNISKINNIASSMGDLVHEKITAIRDDIYSTKGLSAELGKSLSESGVFDYAFNRSKERYTDEEKAKENTIGFVFNQIEDNMFYLMSKKADMRKLYLGDERETTKLKDILNFFEFHTNVDSGPHKETMLRIIARTNLFHSLKDIDVYDEQGKIVLNEALGKYANTYMEHFILSKSADNEGFKAEDVDLVLKNIILKYKQATSDNSINKLLQLKAVMKSIGLDIDLDKLVIDEKTGRLTLNKDYIALTSDINKDDANTVINEKLQKNARKILNKVVPLFYEADFNDKSADTYLYSKGDNTLYRAGNRRYYFNDLYKMFDNVSIDKNKFNMAELVSYTIRMSITANDAVDHMMFALKKLNPTLVNSMTPKTLEGFVNKIVTDEYVTRMQIPNIDLGTYKIVTSSTTTGSGSYSIFEGIGLLTLNKDSNDPVVKEFLSLDNEELLARGWITTFEHGANATKNYIKLPLDLDNTQHINYAYDIMRKRFARQFKELNDDKTGEAINKILESKDLSIQTIGHKLMAIKEVLLSAMLEKQQQYVKAKGIVIDEDKIDIKDPALASYIKYPNQLKGLQEDLIQDITDVYLKTPDTEFDADKFRAIIPEEIQPELEKIVSDIETYKAMTDTEDPKVTETRLRTAIGQAELLINRITEAVKIAKDTAEKNEIVDPGYQKLQDAIIDTSVFSDIEDTINKQIKSLNNFYVRDTEDGLLSQLYTYAHYGFGAMFADYLPKRGGSLGAFGDPNKMISAMQDILDKREREYIQQGKTFQVVIIPDPVIHGVTLADGGDYLHQYYIDKENKVFGEAGKAVILVNGTLVKVQSQAIAANENFQAIFGNNDYMDYDQIILAPNIKIISPAMLDLYDKNKTTTSSGVEVIKLTGEDAKKYLMNRFIASIRNPEVHDIADSWQHGIVDKTVLKYANEAEIESLQRTALKLSKIADKNSTDYKEAVESYLGSLHYTFKSMGASLVIDKWDPNSNKGIVRYKISDPAKIKARTIYGDDTKESYSSVGALSDKAIMGLLNKAIDNIKDNVTKLPDFLTDEIVREFYKFGYRYIDMVSNGKQYTDSDIKRLEKDFKTQGFTINTILDVIAADKNSLLFKDNENYFFVSNRSPLITVGGKAAMLLTHIVPNSNAVQLSGTHLKIGGLDFDGDTGNVTKARYLKELYKDYYTKITKGIENVVPYNELSATDLIEIVNTYHTKEAGVNANKKLADLSPEEIMLHDKKLEAQITKQRNSYYAFYQEHDKEFLELLKKNPSKERIALELAKLKERAMEKAETDYAMSGMLGNIVHKVTMTEDYAKIKIADNRETLSELFPAISKDIYDNLTPYQKKIVDKLDKYRIKEIDDNQYSIMNIKQVTNVHGKGGLINMQFSHINKDYMVGISNVGKDPSLKNMFIVQADKDGFGFRILRHSQIKVSGNNEQIARGIMYDIENSLSSMKAIDEKIGDTYKDNQKFIDEYYTSREVFDKDEYRVFKKNDIIKQIYDAGTEEPKTRNLSKFALHIPGNKRAYFIKELINTAYSNSLLDFDGFVKIKKTIDKPVVETKSEVKYNMSFKYGFDPKGKGTVEGDGKDKAMREIADGFIGELVKEKINKSSTHTSLIAITTTGKARGELQQYGKHTVYSAKTINSDPKLIMLARNGEFKNKPLQPETTEAILEAQNRGAKFVVGDMPGVDTPFIKYLQEIGADFTIYTTNKESVGIRKQPDIVTEIKAQPAKVEYTTIPRLNQFRFTSKDYYAIRAAYGDNIDGFNKLQSDIDEINTAYSRDRDIDGKVKAPVDAISKTLFDGSKGISFDEYETIRNLFFKKGKLEESDIYENWAVLKKYLPKYIKQFGIDMDNPAYNKSEISNYPPGLVRAAVVYNFMTKTELSAVNEQEIRDKNYVGPIDETDGKTEGILVRNGTPVKIKDTDIYAKEAIDKLDNTLKELTSNVSANYRDVLPRYKDSLFEPLSFKHLGITTPEAFKNKIATIQNNSKDKLTIITDKEVDEFFKRIGITKLYTTKAGLVIEYKHETISEGKTIIRTDPMSVEMLYNAYNEYYKTVTKTAKSGDMHKDMATLKQAANDRNIFMSIIEMTNAKQRRALYFRSLGLSSILMKDLYNTVDQATGLPRINYKILTTYANESVGSKYKLSPRDIPLADYKLILENC